ncbi:MAG: hypothetical protein ACYCTZ_11030 [Candidatus Dormibacteria bacterium]
MGARRRGDTDEFGSALGVAALIAGIGAIIDLAARRARAEQGRIIRESKASPANAWQRVGADLRSAIDRQEVASRK